MNDKFKPDLTRKLYVITIEVYPNGQTFSISDEENGYNVELQHVIGSLETVKGAYLRQQGARVVEAVASGIAGDILREPQAREDTAVKPDPTKEGDAQENPKPNQP